MKRVILLSLCLLAAVGGARATTAFYVNDGVVNCPPGIPPQVQALNFVNNNYFQVSFTNLAINPVLYYTSDTINFTNRGIMNGFPGFEFVTTPSTSGQKKMAGTIYNSGTINVASQENVVTLYGYGLYLGTGMPKLLGTATNIINPGLITLGFEGLCRFRGENVNLSRGSLMMTNAGVNLINSFNSLFSSGIYVDGYWGLGNNVFNPQSQFELAVPPQTPSHLVTNRDYVVYYQQLAAPGALAYLDDTTSGSNRLVRAVFMSNTNLAFPANVYFPIYGDIAVEWTAVTTNSLGYAETSYVQLFDYFELFDPFLVWDGYAGAGYTKPTYIPDNYQFYRSVYSLSSYGFYYGNPVSPGGIPTGTFNNYSSTNRYTAYEAMFLPTTLVMSDVPSQNPTNLPGRIEISASKTMDLNRARISSLNYLKLESTNHFLGSSRAKISSPYNDISLRSTNGSLSISNLLVKTLPMPEGTIDLYSSCWTNVVGGVTNTYHILYVDSRLAPETPPRVQSLVLRSTNSVTHDDSLEIHDALNVTRDLCLDARRITISTNEPGAPIAFGSIDLLSTSILWPNSTPRLQFLTNNGVLRTLNAVFFGGTRSTPFYTSNYTEPYVSFVNRGGITNAGSLIWATHFENYGTFQSGYGDVQLQKCAGALLTNGAFLASNGIVAISAGGVLVSNHTLIGGTGISLNLTNVLSDGVPNLALLDPTVQNTTYITNGNEWRCSGGLYLPTKPARGDLLGTTIHAVATPNAEISILWGAQDRGRDVYNPTNSGFLNNAALGKLILAGQDADSTFSFGNPGKPNTRSALYVDCIELRDVTSTNFDANGNLLGVQIAGNMRVYYAQAIANGISVAEKLNGQNGGGFVWVSNYNYGYFSSTNIVYPDGTTNRLNTALVRSCDLDSNTNGIVNCMDPAPLILTTWKPLVSDVVTNLSEIAPPVVDVIVNPGNPNPGDPGTPVATLPTLSLPPAADFLPTGSLAAAAGKYSGLLADDNGVTVGSCGYFTATVSAGGAFSGKLLLSTGTYSFAGKFGAEGSATISVRRGTYSTLTLALDVDLNGGDQIRGTLTDTGRWSARVHADRLVFNKTTNPATSNKGTLTYTLIIPPITGGPAGYGYGTVKVDAAGTVQWSGTLADGTKVTQSSALAKDGFWPFYNSLYSGKGVSLGWLQFTNQTGSDLSGNQIWIKPAGVNATYYSGGVTNALPVLGSRYTAPASGQRLFNMVNGKLVFSVGSNQFTNLFTLTAANRVIKPAGSSLSLTFTPASGLFSGSTLNPVSGKVFSFQGVLFEQGTNGFGLFLKPSEIGQVYLSPAP